MVKLTTAGLNTSEIGVGSSACSISVGSNEHSGDGDALALLVNSVDDPVCLLASAGYRQIPPFYWFGLLAAEQMRTMDLLGRRNRVGSRSRSNRAR
jgi:hypothetical protein